MELRDGTQVGVDGCRAGWIAVIATSDAVTSVISASLAGLLSGLPLNSLIAIDIPIGLTERGARECDRKARELLGAPRASSVFPAPTRPILPATSYIEACAMRQAIEGLRMSQQAFAILPKIREVDELLQLHPELRARVREVHPEVTFAIWNGRVAMAAKKKSLAGRTQRESLIDSKWPGARESILKAMPRSQAARDDLNDAFAALWTAGRIASGQAIGMPSIAPSDSTGLSMEILA